MRPKSLGIQLLLWILVPLAVVFLFNMANAWRSARDIADLRTDRTLLASARVIAESIRVDESGFDAPIMPAALEIFESETPDRVIYGVYRPDGTLAAGNPALEKPQVLPIGSAPVYFTSSFRGAPVRAVALGQEIFAAKGGGTALVIVAQAQAGHDAMVTRLWHAAMRDQLLLVVSVSAFVLYGLRRGLAPLQNLGRELDKRAARNLKSLPTQGVQTELLPLVSALNSALGKVEQQVATQRRFVANAAHQLRTPLALLKTQGTFGLRAKGVKDKNEALQGITKSVDGMSRVVTQLLSLARAEQGHDLLRKDLIDLRNIARNAVEKALPQAHEADLDLGIELAPHAATVLGHQGLLEELVANLIDNALKHAPATTRVTARVATAGALAVLVVEDAGPGIAQAEQEAVFERFQRGAAEGGSGAGLGLAIVREIALAHNGSVTLKTRDPPPGLLVQVLLPLSGQGAA